MDWYWEQIKQNLQVDQIKKQKVFKKPAQLLVEQQSHTQYITYDDTFSPEALRDMFLSVNVPHVDTMKDHLLSTQDSKQAAELPHWDSLGLPVSGNSELLQKSST